MRYLVYIKKMKITEQRWIVFPVPAAASTNQPVTLAKPRLNFSDHYNLVSHNALESAMLPRPCIWGHFSYMTCLLQGDQFHSVLKKAPVIKFPVYYSPFLNYGKKSGLLSFYALWRFELCGFSLRQVSWTFDIGTKTIQWLSSQYGNLVLSRNPHFWGWILRKTFSEILSTDYLETNRKSGCIYWSILKTSLSILKSFTRDSSQYPVGSAILTLKWFYNKSLF